MYARLPSFDSRLETDNIRFAIVFNSISSYPDTIPLLSDPAPEPMIPPTKRREPTLRWAPLPVSPSSSSSKDKPVRSWARQSVREPAPPSMVKRSREPVPRSAPGGWRKYAPSETVARVRKWCKKHADADRSQDPIMTKAGSKVVIIVVAKIERPTFLIIRVYPPKAVPVERPRRTPGSSSRLSRSK
ncbi:MAG: hypothetical protein LQ339_003241 [Xanthoria mediterranea]|nr:MAG: hypothetical protein LQ339_003241 [Xanthoria mediterranea]